MHRSVKKGFTLRLDQAAFIKRQASIEGHHNESRVVQDIVRDFQQRAEREQGGTEASEG